MESLQAVEREVDKALELFTGFYDAMDEEIDKTIEFAIQNIEDIMKSKEKIRLNSTTKEFLIDLTLLFMLSR